MSAMSYTNSQTLSAASSTKGKITYSVIGATPTGVTFDTDTGILTYKNSMAVLSTIEIRATSSHGGQGDILISFLPVPSNHAIYIKNPASGDTDYSISVPVSTSKTFYFALDNAGASIYYSYALRAPMSHMQIADFNGHYKDATTGNY
jgi:hypothetical protein